MSCSPSTWHSQGRKSTACRGQLSGHCRSEYSIPLESPLEGEGSTGMEARPRALLGGQFLIPLPQAPQVGIRLGGAGAGLCSDSRRASDTSPCELAGLPSTVQREHRKKQARKSRRALWRSGPRPECNSMYTSARSHLASVTRSIDGGGRKEKGRRCQVIFGGAFRLSGLATHLCRAPSAEKHGLTSFMQFLIQSLMKAGSANSSDNKASKQVHSTVLCSMIR